MIVNSSKIGEDITETLDVVPRQWFMTEHVRKKFRCRSCEKMRWSNATSIRLSARDPHSGSCKGCSLSLT
jgi:transposase